LASSGSVARRLQGVFELLLELLLDALALLAHVAARRRRGAPAAGAPPDE
jgi:hypothetical protein